MHCASGTHRTRGFFACAALGTMLLGLASRRFPWMFPAILEQYPGDALWALMVMCLLGIVWPGLSTFRLALTALSISFAVEFGQLYQPPWLTAIRETTPGHLVLGSTFNPVDLVAYAIGICVGYVLLSVVGNTRRA